MKNKIGWCNLTFNPVWGCLNNCPYCYARAIAKRFWKGIAKKELRYELDNGFPDYDYSAEGTPNFLSKFYPIFLESHFIKEFPEKPQRIFVGSMSEIYYWEKGWIERVIEKVKQYPQHTFMFLTKYQEMYDRIDWPMNCWLGVTAVKVEDFVREIPPGGILLDDNISFLCIEPIQEKIEPILFSEGLIDWVIVGAETGNRKDKVIPKKEWIDEIVNCCKEKGIPIYLKDNLRDIYPEEIKEFPRL